MSMRRTLLSPGRAWIAALAICAATTTSAKADLLGLTVQNNAGQTFSTGNFAFVGGNLAGQSGTFSFAGGYKFAYTISASYNPASPSTQVISLHGTLTNTAGAPSPNQSLFSYTLSGTFAQPTGSVGFLTGGLTSSFLGTSGANALSSVNTQAEANSVPTSTIGHTFGGVNPTTTNTVAVSPLNAGYSLSSLSGSFTAGGAGSNLDFVATASISLPEPASIIAGIMGLPCMGVALGFVRRKLTGVSTGAELAV